MVRNIKKVGHGKLSLTRHVGSGFPQIELEVDVFQTREDELKFFYSPKRDSGGFLTIESRRADTPIGNDVGRAGEGKPTDEPIHPGSEVRSLESSTKRDENE